MGKTKLSSERKNNLVALAKLVNKQNLYPVPVNKELLDCFDLAVTPEENEFLLRMGPKPLNYEQLSSLSDLPDVQFRVFLQTMLEKGFVWLWHEDEEEERYILAPILVGWFEMYLSDGKETPEKKEFARRVDNYFRSFQKNNIFPLRNLMNYMVKAKTKPQIGIVPAKKSSEPKKTVTIEVNQKVDVPETKIYPSQTVYELIEKYGDDNKIALVHCFCRQWRKLVDEPCRLDMPHEACIVLGKFTRYVVKAGIGRYISKEKALEVIEETKEKGAVHQVFHEWEDINRPEIAICNCCWDCCGILGSYNRGALPLYYKSFYLAEIPDDELCTGCGTCKKCCPVCAISLVDKKSVINSDICIGCGQCELQCPENVIALKFEEREVWLPLQKKSAARIANL